MRKSSAYSKSHGELGFRRFHQVHAHGVEAQEGVELGGVRYEKARWPAGAELGRGGHFSDGLTFLAHDQPAKD